MKHKSKVFLHFKYLKALVENQFEHKVSILRTNGGKEFSNNKFAEFLKHNGIIHQLKCPYTLE